MVKRLMNRLFLSCQRATELLEKNLHDKLTLRERYKLRMHKMMCDACRRYDKQNLFLDNHLKYHGFLYGQKPDHEDLKQKINEKLRMKS